MYTYLFLPCVRTFRTLKDGKAIDKLKTPSKQHGRLTVYNFKIFGNLKTIVNCLQTCLKANQTAERQRVLKHLNNLFAGNTRRLWRPTTSGYLGLPLEFCKFFLGGAMEIFPLLFYLRDCSLGCSDRIYCLGYFFPWYLFLFVGHSIFSFGLD